MSFIADFVKESIRLRNQGRCLHFVDNTRCDQIINAHSIQKQGQLRLIAEDGHVLRFNADFSTLTKSSGRPAPKKIGINRVSTFLGFCETHDGLRFERIDRGPLTPNHEEVALYGYRSLCRSYFAKENAVTLMDSMSRNRHITADKADLLRIMKSGHELGFEQLKRHKADYDQSLASDNFFDFSYVAFLSNSPMHLQLSGVLYPEFDFLAERLQDLSNPQENRGLIAFFTAPTKTGWAFCFAWHQSSSEICVPFIRSLATIMYEKYELADALIKFVFSNCENHAFRISWWNKLSSEVKQEISDRILHMALPTATIAPNYLTSGIRGMAEWTFDVVHSRSDI